MTENEKKIKYSQEYWDVKNSGTRLFHKLSPREDGTFKPFEPTQSDFNALKSILGYINRVENKTILNNSLFAKLYIMHLTQEIRRNETTVFNQTMFKSLSSKLALPLEMYYKIFYDDLCNNQFNRLTKSDFTDKDGNEVVMNYERFKETFPIEYVTDKLIKAMNLTLHRRS